MSDGDLFGPAMDNNTRSFGLPLGGAWTNLRRRDRRWALVWFGPGKPTSPFRKDYYSAVAQLVPVLMLALAVESRVLSAAFARGPRRPSRNRADQWLMDHDGWLPFMIVGLPMLTLAVGELSAIAALGGTSPRFPAWCTDFALGLGIGAIATVPVWNRAGDAHPAGARPPLSRDRLRGTHRGARQARAGRLARYQRKSWP